MHVSVNALMIKLGILTVLLLCVTDSSHAQCAPGIPSGGNPNCLPPDVLYKNQGVSQPLMQRRVVIRQKWSDRWGAISADGIVGSLGFVVGYPTKRAAENAALKECKLGGGQKCKTPTAFNNQCAAFVVSNKGAVIYTAANEKKAADLGLAQCEREIGGCSVYKTACSHAEAVPIR